MLRLACKACYYFKVDMKIAQVWEYKTLDDVPIEIRDFSFEAWNLLNVKTKKNPLLDLSKFLIDIFN